MAQVQYLFGEVRPTGREVRQKKFFFFFFERRNQTFYMYNKYRVNV